MTKRYLTKARLRLSALLAVALLGGVLTLAAAPASAAIGDADQCFVDGSDVLILTAQENPAPIRYLSLIHI